VRYRRRKLNLPANFPKRPRIENRDERIRELLEKGHRAEEIAKELGYSLSYIYRLATKLGLRPKRIIISWEEKKKKILEAFERKGYLSVADLTKLGGSNYLQILRELGAKKLRFASGGSGRRSISTHSLFGSYTGLTIWYLHQENEQLKDFIASILPDLQEPNVRRMLTRIFRNQGFSLNVIYDIYQRKPEIKIATPSGVEVNFEYLLAKNLIDFVNQLEKENVQLKQKLSELENKLASLKL